MQEGGGRARSAVEYECQRPVRGRTFGDIGGVEYRGALIAGLVVERQRSGSPSIAELTARRIYGMFGDRVARQQPQHAFTGFVLFDARRLFWMFVLRLVLRSGRTKSAGKNYRQRKPQNGICLHGTPHSRNYVPPAVSLMVLSPAEVRPALRRTGHRRVAFVTEADAPALQVVGRHFHDHTVADASSDTEFTHLPGGIGQHLMLVIELHPEIAIGQNFGHRPVEFQQFFLRHPIVSRSAFCFVHGLIRKSLHTFRDHALSPRAVTDVTPRLARTLEECNISNVSWLPR